jgi:hypothetical protein
MALDGREKPEAAIFGPVGSGSSWRLRACNNFSERDADQHRTICTRNRKPQKPQTPQRGPKHQSNSKKEITHIVTVVFLCGLQEFLRRRRFLRFLERLATNLRKIVALQWETPGEVAAVFCG